MNGTVVMPQCGLREDGVLREIFEEYVPGRDVVQVPIPSIAISGSHCITQQEPRA